jgi:hypothetical protein
MFTGLKRPRVSSLKFEIDPSLQAGVTVGAGGKFLLCFTKLLRALACAALTALTVVLLFTAALLNAARKQIEAIPNITRAEFAATRSDLHDAVLAAVAAVDRNVASATSAMNYTMNRQGDAIRKTVDAQADSLRSDTTNHLTTITERLDHQLTRTNDSIAKLASVAEPARGAIAKIDGALPYYTDCDAGMCLANLIYGISRETEKTLRSVERTMEVIAAKSPPVAASLQRSASAVEIRSRQSILRNLFFSLKNEAK